MPSVRGLLAEQEIADVVQYLTTLRGGTGRRSNPALCCTRIRSPATG